MDPEYACSYFERCVSQMRWYVCRVRVFSRRFESFLGRAKTVFEMIVHGYGAWTFGIRGGLGRSEVAGVLFWLR